MAPSEETEKECSNGDKIPETKITGTMNSDVNDVNSIIGASDKKTNQISPLILKVSTYL